MNPEEHQASVRPAPPTEGGASVGGAGDVKLSGGAPGGAKGGTSHADPSARLLELLQSWRAGLSIVWRRKFLWLVLSIFTPGWLIAVYHWAALPLARPWQLALVAATGLMLIALPAAAMWLVFRGIDWSLLLSPDGYTSVVLLALLGVWLPHQLIWWVTPFESATLEGALAAIRFIAADVIFNGSLLWLGGVLSWERRSPDRLRPETEPRP